MERPTTEFLDDRKTSPLSTAGSTPSPRSGQVLVPVQAVIILPLLEDMDIIISQDFPLLSRLFAVQPDPSHVILDIPRHEPRYRVDEPRGYDKRRTDGEAVSVPVVFPLGHEKLGSNGPARLCQTVLDGDTDGSSRGPMEFCGPPWVENHKVHPVKGGADDAGGVEATP